MPERPQTEDIMVYKGERKTKLSVEEEFLHDMQSMVYLDAVKRRRLECFSKVKEEQNYPSHLPIVQQSIY